jgi:hypothetical protein
MDVRFTAPTLARMDELRCEALALPFFSDERPLQGALGLVDWRLCGMISRMIENQRIDGSLGEAAMLPGRPRLSIEKLFLFGLGPMDGFDVDVFGGSLSLILSTLTDAKIRTSALVLPGRSVSRIDPTPAAEIFIRAATGVAEQDELTLIEPAEAQKEMLLVVEAERRRARAAEV